MRSEAALKGPKVNAPLNLLADRPMVDATAVLAAALAALFVAVTSPAGVALPARVRGHSQPGGARIPGTSFELAPTVAAGAMAALLQSHRDATFAQRFAETLARTDTASRAAPGYGQTGPLMAEVLAVCSTGLAKRTDEMQTGAPALPMDAALVALEASLAAQFRPEEVKRVLVCFKNPATLAAMPIRDFMALLVRL